MINYVALKTECTTDPTGLGLVVPYNAGEDGTVASILNLRRASIQIKRRDIAPREVFHALALADLVTNPGATSNSYLESLLTSPFELQLLNDDGTSTPVRDNVLSLLKAGASGTKTRLAALETRDGSRAEQLFGMGTFIQPSDIVQARNS